MLMKKLLLTLALCAPVLSPAFAQEAAPIIKELRAIIADAGTGFKSYKGESAGKDEASGSSFFKSSHTPEASISEHFMFEKDATKHAVYIVRFNVKDMDAMYLKLMMIMAQKYMDEFNLMAKSGKYVGRDYKNADGADVTEIKDNEGHNIVDYQSTADQQMIMVYGTNGH